MNLLLKLITFPFTLPYKVYLSIRWFYLFKVKPTLAGIAAGTKTAITTARTLNSDSTPKN
jgi:hypothetical protein